MKVQQPQIQNYIQPTRQEAAKPTSSEQQDEFHYSSHQARVAGGALFGALEGGIASTIGAVSPHASTIGLVTLGCGVKGGVSGMMSDYSAGPKAVGYGLKGVVIGGLSSTLGTFCGYKGVIASTFIGAAAGAILANLE